jgi:hypothetical protein
VELYVHSTNTSSWRGAQSKHRDNFTYKRREEGSEKEMEDSNRETDKESGRK